MSQFSPHQMCRRAKWTDSQRYLPPAVYLSPPLCARTLSHGRGLALVRKKHAHANSLEYTPAVRSSMGAPDKPTHAPQYVSLWLGETEIRPCDVRWEWSLRVTSSSALLKKQKKPQKNPNNLSRHYINTGGLSCRHCARILVPSATCPQMCKWVENGSKLRNNITSTAASFVVLSYSEETRMKCQRRPRLSFDSGPCDAG